MTASIQLSDASIAKLFFQIMSATYSHAYHDHHWLVLQMEDRFNEVFPPI